MRYRLMATYRGVPYEAGVGPAGGDVVLFAACPPPEELGFEPATGHWRKRVVRAEVDALWESRPVGVFRGEPCMVLDDLGERLHIAYLGTDALRAAHLGYWQVDRGVFELLTPRDEVTGLAEERVERPLRWNATAQHTGPLPAYPYGTAPWPAQPAAGTAPAGAPPADGRWDPPGPEPVPPINGSAAGHVNGSQPLPPGTLPPAAQPAAYPAAAGAPGQPPGPGSGWHPDGGPGAGSTSLNSTDLIGAGFNGAPVPGSGLGLPGLPVPAPAPLPPATGPMPAMPPVAPPPGPALPQRNPAAYGRPAAPGPSALWDIPPGRAVPSPRDSTGSHAVPLARAVAAGQAAAATQQAPDSTGSHPLPFPGISPGGSAAGQPGLDEPSIPGQGGRSARRQRVPTRAIFCELADLAAIPRHAYALEAETDGAMCLLHTGNGYEVFVAAEGARLEVRTFGDEEAAYFYLFGVLVAESIRNGGLAPK